MQIFDFRHNIQYYEGNLATVYCANSSKNGLFGQAPRSGPTPLAILMDKCACDSGSVRCGEAPRKETSRRASGP